MDRARSTVVSDAGWSRYAVVLIDLQNDFWPDDVASTAPELPTRVAGLLDYARTHDLTVVHVRARFDADGGNWMARYRLLGRIPCIDGTIGAETLPFAHEIAGEPVVIKHSFDGFLDTDLHDLLTARSIRGLLIGGLVTSTCVLFTAATATQLGYLVSVLSDCCSDFETAHSATLHAYRYIFDAVPSIEIADQRAKWDTQLKTMHPGG
jgi:nicotinamidase-related amidase